MHLILSFPSNPIKQMQRKTYAAVTVYVLAFSFAIIAISVVFAVPEEEPFTFAV